MNTSLWKYIISLAFIQLLMITMIGFVLARVDADYLVRPEVRGISAGIAVAVTTVLIFFIFVKSKKFKTSVTDYRYYEDLMRDCPDTIIHGFDSNRVIQYWNHASEKHFGVKEYDAIDKKIEDFMIFQSDVKQCVANIERWERSGYPTNPVELRLRKNGCSPIYVSAVFRQFDTPGGIRTYFIALDITKHKLELEKLWMKVKS